METESSRSTSIDYLLDLEKSFDVYRSPPLMELYEFLNPDEVIDKWFDADDGSNVPLVDENDHDYAGTADIKNSLKEAFEEVDSVEVM